MEVRTRFAPSPTGFQHIGGFRTALYAWLLARHHGGKFVLRIEDTDQARRVDGAIRFIIEELAWFGIDIDEGPTREDLTAIGEVWDEAPDIGGPYGPYVQSQRLDVYHQARESLIASGHAYRCDCTAEMLEKEREEQKKRGVAVPGYSGRCRERNVSADTPHVVRFRMPEDLSLSLDDAIKGTITWDDVSLRDPVLQKTDGFPTYHLAVVCDDHHMKISHVLRGDEWISSAPLHLLLYQALGWEKPVFAHLPTVLGTDGKKLSKRHGSVALNAFREQGYLPEALRNYVALVGWSPGDGEEQEVFSREELIERFSLAKVNKASGTFDYEKLTWMNGVYIRNLSQDELTKKVKPLFEKEELNFDSEAWSVVAPHVQERLKLLPEVIEKTDFLFQETIERDMPQMFKKKMTPELALQVLAEAEKRLLELPEFSTSDVEAVLRKLAEDLELKAGPAFGVIRIAATGKTVTPPLFESLSALGKERTLQRLKECREALEKEEAS